ncbi:hypothetical protein HPB49_002031 [Dermacentor silvarum]|uniref:Uncharacterized protein n=1 Tax=Dermacentor silvarum TaxID=543639 RepID=A0ACB8CUP6_DERSI|nr:hypothetical protein HPB49_002031 [Dermacentor silvarum]
MPNTREVHSISPSPPQHTSDGRSPRSQGSDFSEDRDAVIARFCALINEMPDNSDTQLPAGGEEEDALSSVSEATVVTAALPSDLGSRVQRRIREIEDEILSYCTLAAHKAPVKARKFITSKVFEMVAFCSDLRADAATYRGATLALQGQNADVRRENAALQKRLHSQPRTALQDDFPARSGESHFGPDFSAPAASAGGLGGRSVAPTSGPPGGLSYAAVLGAGPAHARAGHPVGVAARAPSLPTHNHVAFLTPIAQTTAPARDVLRLLKTNIDPGAKHIKDISLHHTRYGLTVFSNNKQSLDNLQQAIKDNSVTRASMLVRLGQKRNPHIKFNGVDPDIAPDEFLRVLNEGNEGLDLDLEKCKVRVTFRERAGTSAFVAEVDPDAFKRIMKWPHLSVGWTSVLASEDLHVPTCTYCATYGHGRMTCPHKDEPAKAACMKCGGNNLAVTCRVRIGDDAVCCTECKKLGHATTHPTGFPSCPALLEKVGRLRARTNYGA